MIALESAQGADGMNVFAKPTAAGAVAKLDLGLFRDAVFKSEFAVYVIRFDEDGTGRFEDAIRSALPGKF
jgi:hypothetical protein